MQSFRQAINSKRTITWFMLAYMVSAVVVAPAISINKPQDENAAFSHSPALMRVLVWPTYVWERLNEPVFQTHMHAKAETELKKFNLIWFYLAHANRSISMHELRYPNVDTFLANCKNFDDYIMSLHQMLYASHALDVRMLNSMYPELGTMFQRTWVKGASLMLNACISGSESTFQRSRAASNEWFSWYGANSQEIDAALQAI